MTDAQLIRNAEDPNIYGRFVDVGAAFNKGLMIGTKGNPLATSDPVSTVKNNYENKLNSYLDALPADTDITSVPDIYKNNIHQFLQTQKHNYVVLGKQLALQEVGSDKYMDLQGQMTNIKNSFTNLNDHMKNYGQMKDKLFEDIKTNKTSLSIENQANINLLTSVFSEEFEMSIDEYGNPSFVGDDGAIQMGKLPGYELKSVTAANSMLKMAEAAYKSGVKLAPGHPQYEIKKRELTNMIESGGRNTLMSIISDGMIGDVTMSEDPYISQHVDAFREGSLSFKGLRDVVVENYMGVLSSMSESGYKAKQVAASRRQPTPGGTRSNKYYSMAPMKNEFGETTGYIRSNYDVSQPSLILTVGEYQSGMAFDSPDRQQVKSATETPSSEEGVKAKTRNQAAKEAKEGDANIRLPKRG